MKKKLSENESCLFYQQIISGIEYLHKLKYVHRDIKPENLLINEETKELKIVDFGLSNVYTNSNKSLFHSPSNFSVKIKNEEISKYISDSSPINLKKNQNFINSRTNKNISNLEFEIKNNNTLNKSIKYSLKENYAWLMYGQNPNEKEP